MLPPTELMSKINPFALLVDSSSTQIVFGDLSVRTLDATSTWVESSWPMTTYYRLNDLVIGPDGNRHAVMHKGYSGMFLLTTP